MTNYMKILGASALSALLLAPPALAQEEDYGAWDGDGDGMWSEEEFGEGFGEGEEDSFGMWDEDDDGMLSEDEYNAGVMGAYDEDDDGFLNEEEQAAFMEDDEGGFWGDEEEVE